MSDTNGLVKLVKNYEPFGIVQDTQSGFGASWTSGRTRRAKCTTDMLFVITLCPSSPLHRAFPGTPFVSLAGRTPLLLWFSRITSAQYHRPQAEPALLEDRTAGLYNELNIMAVLRHRVLFAPIILSTSAVNTEIGHTYGMPKRTGPVWFQVERRRIDSGTTLELGNSRVRAQLLGAGRVLGILASRVWPRWTWSVAFPDGRSIRALLQATPRLRPAYVHGQLGPQMPWLPKPAPLWPIGVYIPGLRMRLPPPG